MGKNTDIILLTIIYPLIRITHLIWDKEFEKMIDKILKH